MGLTPGGQLTEGTVVGVKGVQGPGAIDKTKEVKA